MPVLHKIPSNSPPEAQWDNRPWSLMVFDEDLNKVAEFPFEAKTYLPHSIFTSPEGIWLQPFNEEDRTAYQLFTLSKN